MTWEVFVVFFVVFLCFCGFNFGIFCHFWAHSLLHVQVIVWFLSCSFHELLERPRTTSKWFQKRSLALHLCHKLAEDYVMAVLRLHMAEVGQNRPNWYLFGVIKPATLRVFLFKTRALTGGF